MDAHWTSLSGWLLRLTVAAGLVLLAAWLAQRWLTQPARRQRLGELGLLAALGAVALACLPSWWALPWPAQEEKPTMTMAAEPDIVWPVNIVWLPDEDDPAVAAPASGPELLPLPREAQTPPDLLACVEQPEQPAPDKPAVTLLAHLKPLLCLMFIAGAAWFTLRWLLGHLALQRLLRRAERPPPSVLRVFRRHTDGWKNRPRLLVSSRLRAPVSFGVWRPTVLIPASLCEAEHQQRLAWVFAHELTHLRRRDALSAMLFALGQVLFFFLPWFWQLRRQVRLCQEYIADAAALEQAPPEDYAEFLLSFTTAPRVPQAAAGVSGNTSDLYRRVSMLLTNRQTVEGRCPRWWLAAAAICLFVLAGVVGGAGPASAQQAQRIILVAPDQGAQPIQIPLPGPDGTFQIRLPKPDGPQADVLFFKGQPGQLVPGQFVPGQPFQIQIPQDKIIIKKIVVDPETGQAQPRVIQKKDGVIEIELVFPGQDAKPGQGLPRVIQKDGKIQIEIEQPKKPGAGPVPVPPVPGVPGVPGARFWVEEFDVPFGGGQVDLERLRKVLEKLKQDKVDVQALRKEIEEAIKGVERGQGQRFYLRMANAGNLRENLGFKLNKPNETLAEQLNLQRGHGLVVTEVKADSPAGKAGVKVNDLIVKVQDKAVTDDPDAFYRQLQDRKEVDLVVLRKGKEETIRGLKLPEGQGQPGWANWGGRFQVPAAGPGQPPNQPGPKGFAVPAFGPGVPGVPGQQGVMTTTFRTGERFNTRHQEGNLIITVTGKVENNKAVPQEIQVQDGQVVNRYENMERVPAAYRDKVQHMLQISAGPEVRK